MGISYHVFFALAGPCLKNDFQCNLKQALWQSTKGYFQSTRNLGIAKPVGTHQNPVGTQFPELLPRNRFRNRNQFPEPGPGTRLEHTEIYIVQRPHSILLLGKKYYLIMLLREISGPGQLTWNPRRRQTLFNGFEKGMEWLVHVHFQNVQNLTQ